MNITLTILLFALMSLISMITTAVIIFFAIKKIRQKALKKLAQINE